MTGKKVKDRLVLEDHIGKTYGHLTILADVQRIGEYRRVRCRCECGREATPLLARVIYGKVKACGVCVYSGKNRRGNRSSDYTPKVIEDGDKDQYSRAVNYLYTNYRANAITHHRDFLLTRETFHTLIHQPCKYCKVPYEFKKARKNSAQDNTMENYPCVGIDRVDSRIGYTPENTVPCCSICNRAKNVLSDAEFTAYCERLRVAHELRLLSKTVTYGAVKVAWFNLN